MKYIVLLGDGMADYPLAELGNKTPLHAARKPNIDRLARYGELGLVKTIPDSLPPGSDVANLSVLGYAPEKYYTGRSPLEAASMGIILRDTDITFRTNLVTLSDGSGYKDRLMIDHSSDEITTEEAHLLMDAIRASFNNNSLTFYKGISYRHCLLWENGSLNFELTPPHDILGESVADYLPKGKDAQFILEMMEQSAKLLENHPVNIKRIEKGLKPANSIWIWGQGRKPAIPYFKEMFGLDGAVISAVDLIKGLGILAGMDSIDVEGATGNIDTNYVGKAQAALDLLKAGKDFVFVHVEAPDECGHRYEIDNKVRSIELIDELVMGTLLDGLQEYEDYKILVLPDHATPLSLRTHTRDPVPYIVYQKSKASKGLSDGYDEQKAANTGRTFERGSELMAYFTK
ncbi:MAG TPA: cofactor-independent phosphoglycerate mutase [Bacillota bacterium]|nr:cofactor-independent phosphoglycerate mutase [Bacillota bacterium]